jgi:hypothetical protein
MLYASRSGSHGRGIKLISEPRPFSPFEALCEYCIVGISGAVGCESVTHTLRIEGVAKLAVRTCVPLARGQTRIRIEVQTTGTVLTTPCVIDMLSLCRTRPTSEWRTEFRCLRRAISEHLSSVVLSCSTHRVQRHLPRCLRDRHRRSQQSVLWASVWVDSERES